MKPIMHQDHLNSPGSDEGCHTNLHQERRAPSTEPYPLWNQDGYPLRSFTPPYQRQHESSESCQQDDRSVLVCNCLRISVTCLYKDRLFVDSYFFFLVDPPVNPVSFSTEVIGLAPNRTLMKREPMTA